MVAFQQPLQFCYSGLIAARLCKRKRHSALTLRVKVHKDFLFERVIRDDDDEVKGLNYLFARSETMAILDTYLQSWPIKEKSNTQRY